MTGKRREWIIVLGPVKFARIDTLFLECPEGSKHQEDGGQGDNLVSDIVHGARTFRTVLGGRQRMRYGVRWSLHLAPAFHCLFGYL
jgi:hypothetical protein